MHLLSESAAWITESEFVSPVEEISHAIGETVIETGPGEIINKSWAELNGSKQENNYIIEKTTENQYTFRSHNPALGTQSGTLTLDRSKVFSKFKFNNSEFNGFEVIIRNDNTCTAYGGLYNGDALINTWTARMIKRTEE